MQTLTFTKRKNKQTKKPKRSFQANFDWLHSDKKHCNGVTESENSAEEKSFFFVLLESSKCM